MPVDVVHRQFQPHLRAWGAIIRLMLKKTKKTKKTKRATKPVAFTVVIEQDEDGYYVASVPALHGCYTQARTLEELAPRIREVSALRLAEQRAPRLKFVARQPAEVSA